MGKYKPDDISLLLPSLREPVRELTVRMGELGFVCVLFDTLRTPGQAAKNAAKGSGKADSMHCYGAAADLICDVHGWDCHVAGCKFYETLGEQAEALGLVWGGRWHRVDLDHVQGVSIAQQAAMRALGMGDEHAAQRDALVAAHFGGAK